MKTNLVKVNPNWIHLENPSEDEIQSITQKYNIPYDYLYSTLDPDEVSRAEKIHQQNIVQPALISLLYPLEDNQDSTTSSYINRTLSIILCENHVITCCKKNPVFLEEVMSQQFTLINSADQVYSISIELIWRVTRSYVFACRDVTSDMDTLYKKSRKSTKSDLIYDLADLDRSIIYLRTAVDENEPILQDISEAPYMQQYAEWIHDIFVENHQAQAMLDQTHQIAEHMDTTFSSIIQNNLNEIMKILTSLTIIVTIPTITAGLWGMNVDLPFMSHPAAFVIVGLITLAFMGIVILWLKYKDML